MDISHFFPHPSILPVLSLVIRVNTYIYFYSEDRALCASLESDLFDQIVKMV